MSLVDPHKKKKPGGTGLLKSLGKLAGGFGLGGKKKKGSSPTTGGDIDPLSGDVSPMAMTPGEEQVRATPRGTAPSSTEQFVSDDLSGVESGKGAVS